jgi:hypothetical protein
MALYAYLREHPSKFIHLICLSSVKFVGEVLLKGKEGCPSVGLKGKKNRCEDEIESLRLSSPTDLKSAPRTTQAHHSTRISLRL